jgi:protein TonB
MAPDLFADVTAGRTRAGRSRVPISAALHALALAPLILVPFHPSAAPAVREYVPILWNPPPPPPPPLARGAGLTTRPRRVMGTPAPQTVAFVQPVEWVPEARYPDAAETGGDPDGTDAGDPHGMPGGRKDGVVGGVPGGQPGGVIGGTGTLPIPATSYDRPPRLVRMVRPEYPQRPFVDRVEGEVVLEILIDDRGRVVWTHVVRSLPVFDAAAEAAVQQWVFAPAVEHGRPVASRATVPIRFRLY